MIIFYEEAKYIFISNSILYQILVEAIAEDFLCCMTIHSILNEDRCTCKSEYLCIVEKPDDILMAISEMTAMTLIKNHHDTSMTDFFNPPAIPLLTYSSIELLDGGDDNFGITMKALHKFICVIGTVNSTWLKCLIFGLRLCVKVVPVNNKHNLVHIV